MLTLGVIALVQVQLLLAAHEFWENEKYRLMADKVSLEPRSRCFPFPILTIFCR